MNYLPIFNHDRQHAHSSAARYMSPAQLDILKQVHYMGQLRVIAFGSGGYDCTSQGCPCYVEYRSTFNEYSKAQEVFLIHAILEP